MISNFPRASIISTAPSAESLPSKWYSTLLRASMGCSQRGAVTCCPCPGSMTWLVAVGGGVTAEVLEVTSEPKVDWSIGLMRKLLKGWIGEAAKLLIFDSTMPNAEQWFRDLIACDGRGVLFSLPERVVACGRGFKVLYTSCVGFFFLFDHMF